MTTPGNPGVTLTTRIAVRGPRPAGLLFGTREEPITVLGFIVSGGRIAELDMVSDPAKLRHLVV
jgi:hypothetical protein